MDKERLEKYDHLLNDAELARETQMIMHEIFNRGRVYPSGYIAEVNFQIESKEDPGNYFNLLVAFPMVKVAAAVIFGKRLQFAFEAKDIDYLIDILMEYDALYYSRHVNGRYRDLMNRSYIDPDIFIFNRNIFRNYTPDQFRYKSYIRGHKLNGVEHRGKRKRKGGTTDGTAT